jgi:hypothetical protein
MKNVASFYVLRGQNVITDFSQFRAPFNGEFHHIFPELIAYIEAKTGEKLRIGVGKANILFSKDYTKCVLRNKANTFQILINFTPEFAASRRANDERKAARELELIKSFTGWMEVQKNRRDISPNDASWDERHYAVRFENGVEKEFVNFSSLQHEWWAGDIGYGYMPGSETRREKGENPENYKFSGSFSENWGYGQSDGRECQIGKLLVNADLAAKILGL